MAKRREQAIPQNVRTLGWVSFFTDLSSEILYPLFPFFITVTLGAPALILGITEGIAEAVSAVSKGLSGPLSDTIRRRRVFVFAGYTLSSISKLGIALAPAWGAALPARVAERLGKGVRTPARDALIAEATGQEMRGRAFGFHRAMDTWGAVSGALLAYLFLLLLKDDFRFGILVCLLPAFVGAALTLLVRETVKGRTGRLLSFRQLLFRPPRSVSYRRFVFVYTLFSLGTSSAAFLLLRARFVGFSYAGAILPYILANIVYASTSERAGRWSDAAGRRIVLSVGMSLFTVSYGVAFLFPSKPGIIVAFTLFGLFQATTEGIGKAFVTDVVPRSEYGQALGFFHFLTGVAVLLSSLLAGLLWDYVSPDGPFLQGAIFGLLGSAGMALLIREKARETTRA